MTVHLKLSSLTIKTEDDIDYRFYAPPDCLRDYVDCFWSIEIPHPSGRLTMHTIADNTSCMMLYDHQGNIVSPKGGGTMGTSLVFGQKDTAVACSTWAPFSLTAVQFKPWAMYELLGTRPNDVLVKGLTDLTYTDQFPGTEDNYKLLGTESSMSRVSQLTRFLTGRLKNRAEPDRMVHHALKMIHDNPGSVGVSDLLAYLDISDRQFERRFKQTVGATPIFYIRVNRFNEALRRIRSGHYAKLSDVAYSLNYSDQSHFNKDFNTFAGQTPSKFIKSEAILLGKEKSMMAPRPSFEQVS